MAGNAGVLRLTTSFARGGRAIWARRARTMNGWAVATDRAHFFEWRPEQSYEEHLHRHSIGAECTGELGKDIARSRVSPDAAGRQRALQDRDSRSALFGIAPALNHCRAWVRTGCKALRARPGLKLKIRSVLKVRSVIAGSQSAPATRGLLYGAQR